MLADLVSLQLASLSLLAQKWHLYLRRSPAAILSLSARLCAVRVVPVRFRGKYSHFLLLLALAFRKSRIEDPKCIPKTTFE